MNHAFDRCKAFYGRILSATLNARPAVYIAWALLSLMVIPMYMFSPKELAPLEDQGFMFGIIFNAANASADQKEHFGKAAEKVFWKLQSGKSLSRYLCRRPTLLLPPMV